MTVVRIGVEFQRPVPESWEQDLGLIAPPSNFVSWLKLRWEPGDPWEPIERYVVWHMRHPRFVHPGILRELRGPHPRSTGHYCADGWCACAIKKGCWAGGAARQIDRAQWELFHETGHYGTRWWVLQGDAGGHKHRLDKWESKISRMHGGSADTPVPGQLPYADWDQRAFLKIVHRDRVRTYKHILDYCARSHDQMDAEERDEELRVREQLWSWLESQVKRTVHDIGHSGAVALKDAAREAAPPPRSQVELSDEQVHQEFIEGAV